MARKTISIKKIYTISFLAFMLVMGVVPMVSFFQNSLTNNTEDKETAVSFSELYPFEGTGTKVSSTVQGSPSLFKTAWNKSYKFTEDIEKYTTSLNPLAYPFKSLPKAYYENMNGSVIMNGSSAFVCLPNGNLVDCFDYCPSTKVQENILDFSTWLKEKDIPYVTMITPDKSDDSITEFPAYIPHGYSQMLDEYEVFLDKNEIKYIESKSVLLAENDDLYSWFYASDSHWNVRAAFRMAQETAIVLNDELKIPANTDALDDKNFELTVYPNSFLGGNGRKLGYAWLEDMELLYPKTETNFHIEIPQEGIDKTGSFEDTLLDQSILETNNLYYLFLYGEHALVNIENLNCNNGTRVLFIKYSFADSLCPYLANSVQYLDMIDPRHFDGSIRSYIEQTKPDVVVLCTGVVTEYDEENLQLK